MKELYRLDKKSLTPYNFCKYQIQREKITIKLSGVRMFLYWNLITFFRAKAYVVRDEAGDIIHYSYIIPACSKFPFLRKGIYRDIEIGPCYTRKESRGNGIYPFVLSAIIKEELNNSGFAYMIVENWNHASQKGISKVGFKKVGEIRKDRFKRYAIYREMEVL